MSAILAIIGDTWKQSKQQVVFIIMLVLLLITAAAGIIIPTVVEDDNGEAVVGTIFSDEPADFLEYVWYGSYVEALRVSGHADSMEIPEEDSMEISKESRDKLREKTKEITTLEKGAQAVTLLTVGACFSIALLLFIAAASGYFPALLASGAVDVVLSKPLSRARILIGKYLGGLILFSTAMLATHTILFVGIGLRLGTWNWGLFHCLPLTIFTASTLFAVLALLGILWRSTALCMVVGYFFYLVVDSIISVLITFEMMGGFDDIPWLETTARWIRMTIPNFDLLKTSSVSVVLDVPIFPWQPFVVAACWIAGSLGLSYWVFNRRDF